MTDNLKSLIRVRGSIKQKLTNLEKYIQTIKSCESDKEPSLSEVEIRFNTSHSLLQDFDENQLKIEVLCDEESLSDHYNEREIFEQRYSSAISFINDYIKKHTDLKTQTESVNSPNFNNAILPKIKLPIFKGDSENWLEFKATFISVIHSNTSASNIQKFQLLKASVEGYAKRLIDNIEFTEANYENAWQILCKRFDNKRMLINNHFKSICNIEQLQKESSVNLRRLLDDISNHISSLEGLHISKDTLYELLVTHVISSKLDKITFREWKDFKGKNDLPSLNEFLDFLKNKADLLEQVNDQNLPHQGHLKHNIKPSKVFSQIQSQSVKCNYCKGQHLIYTCPEFLKLNVQARIDNAKKLKLCSNCLKFGHNDISCRFGTCRKCQLKHNTLLHQEQPSRPEQASTSNAQVTMCSNTSSSSQVLLSTAMVKVKDVCGNFHVGRALLDSGAQSNFVTERFFEKLKLPSKVVSISIIGINQVMSNLKKQCDITMSSTSNNFTSALPCFVIPTISNELPNQRIDISNWNIPQNISLADVDFHKPRDVDLLIGASLFWDLLRDGQLSLGKGKPILQNSKLGWIVSGNIPLPLCSTYCNFSQTIYEDEQLKKFWEIEEIPSKAILSQDDQECESFFKNNMSRDESGRFTVKIPLKHPVTLLGESKTTAIKRFYSLERKLASNPDFKQQYCQFMDEYQCLGHMSKLGTAEASDDNSICYYLPHHGVLKELSLSTKLRVVFDGSCPTTSGWSINDLQYIGPKIQNDIFSILLRFRKHTFVVSADVSKMYRQVLIHPNDRCLQRIMWRDNPEDDISIFQLNTVTYGTTSAPYLAMRCLRQLACENKESFPLSSQVILNDFYVDDLLTGSDDLQQLNKICLEISSILKSGCFVLRKWIANNSNILLNVGDSDDPIGVLKLGNNEPSKTLGIQWISKSDTLQYKISEFRRTETISKRVILSDIAQVYDPLGLLSPCVILSKIIIQRLWSLKLGWDDDVPSEWANKWFQFRSNLTQLNHLEIPRHVLGETCQLKELHCFTDASQSAYAACIYALSQNNSDKKHIQLLCAKTKVAPLKTISIPRLELCAALLGAQLMKQAVEALNVSCRCYFWTDSQVVLCWIRNHSNLFQTFVANRVSKIQDLTKTDDWYYINTKLNPADLASRGVLPEKLVSSTIWWNGPQYLMSSKSNWPINFNQNSNDLVIPELKKNVQIFNTVHTESLDIFDKFSNIHKLKRTVSYCFRFYNNCKSKRTKRQTGPLTVAELEHSWLSLLKLCQKQSFSAEIAILDKGSILNSKHRLSSLAPFINEDGLLCVGGRLRLTSLKSSIKHPILLSSNHNLTKLLFHHEHLRLLHAGPQLLLSTIRQRYWPIRGRNLSKSTVRKCIICFKFKPVPVHAPIGTLPEARISQSLPFQHTGTDFAGPFSLQNRKGRGAKMTKCYVCVFICFSTKAVHLELTTSLTTEHFFACLRRFISRRGHPHHIYSDNGTTFLGARNELSKLGEFIHQNQNEISDYATKHNISWHFIPPYSPNFGGLWEAAVKSMKHYLKRIIFNTPLTYEEFSTLLAQIEGILNSRPLFALSSDPNDLCPITPSHFLTGRVITSLPEHDLQEVPPARLSRLQHVQQLMQQFWSRWSKEYLTQLHHQYKWKGNPTKLDVGTLVLIKDSKLPPYQWLLGRVHQLHPGADNVCRVATINTSKGLVKRSTRHLHPLPIQDELQ